MNDLFLALMKRGRIKKYEEGKKLFMKFRLFTKIFVLSYTRCHDFCEVWDYTITDKFGNILVTNQYTQIN